MATKTIDKQKATGSHYTPKILAEFVASHILKNYSGQKTGILKVLDPAVGDGELLLAVAKSLGEHDLRFKLVGGDIDVDAIALANTRVGKLGLDEVSDITATDFLAGDILLAGQQGLFGQSTQYDLVISNPPYVRTQVIGQDVSKALAVKYGLTGRVDLYHAFLVAIASALIEGGIAGDRKSVV